MRINSLAPASTFLLNTTVGVYEKQDLGGSFALDLRGRRQAGWRAMLAAQSQDRRVNAQDRREEALSVPQYQYKGFCFEKKIKQNT